MRKSEKVSEYLEVKLRKQLQDKLIPDLSRTIIIVCINIDFGKPVYGVMRLCSACFRTILGCGL